MSMMKRFLSYSVMINAILAIFVGSGYLLQHFTKIKPLGHVLTTLGLYGLSGSVTNVVAVIMIFDKIPFIIGSGLIEENFEGFKEKLKDILVSYLFSKPPSLSTLAKNIHYQNVAEKLYPHLLKTSFGVMFQWLSIDQVAALLREIHIEEVIAHSFGPKEWDDYLTTQIEKLTPNQLKTLVFQILEDHLQWLVFWGAALGTGIGCIDLLLR